MPNRFRFQRFSLALLLLGRAYTSGAAQTATFTNPLLPSGPDPWVTYKDGYYYYMHTTAVNLTLWKTRNVADLATAEHKVVWTPPKSGPYSRDIWAPEIHFLENRWYIYFSADGGGNVSHRVWVIENANADPMQGDWVIKGKIGDDGDHWAIDGSVFENRGRLYFICSGWEGANDGVQSIYIQALANPYTSTGKRVKISTPTFPWEKVGDRSDPPKDEDNPGLHPERPLHIDVNEGPEMVKHGNRLFLIYSAGACWTDNYALGMLMATDGSDLLDPQSWKQSNIPVLWSSPSAGAYATGHNGFFRSADGKEDWIIYHANSESHQGCGGLRNPRAQRFTWNTDGTPNFGRPAPIHKPLAKPGEAESR